MVRHSLRAREPPFHPAHPAAAIRARAGRASAAQHASARRSRVRAGSGANARRGSVAQDEQVEGQRGGRHHARIRGQGRPPDARVIRPPGRSDHVELPQRADGQPSADRAAGGAGQGRDVRWRGARGPRIRTLRPHWPQRGPTGEGQRHGAEHQQVRRDEERETSHAHTGHAARGQAVRRGEHPLQQGALVEGSAGQHPARHEHAVRQLGRRGAGEEEGSGASPRSAPPRDDASGREEPCRGVHARGSDQGRDQGWESARRSPPLFPPRVSRPGSVRPGLPRPLRGRTRQPRR